MDGVVVGYCVHSQDSLWLGLLGECEDLVVRCWSWLDGELAFGNILEGPFLVYVKVTKGALWNSKGPSWCHEAVVGKFN